MSSETKRLDYSLDINIFPLNGLHNTCSKLFHENASQSIGIGSIQNSKKYFWKTVLKWHIDMDVETYDGKSDEEWV